MPTFNNIGSIFYISEGSLISGVYVVTEPVTVEEAKFFNRLTASAEDSLIQSLITAAREIIEQYLNRSLIPRVVQIECVCDGRNKLELPYGPVIQTETDVYDIQSVYYRFGPTEDWNDISDNTGKTYRFAGLNYCYIFANPGEYRIKYGCQALTGEVYKTAIKQQVVFMYQNRGDQQLQTSASQSNDPAVVCDIVKNTLAGKSRVTWFG